MANGNLIVFVKAPRPGAVKTRLAAKLGDNGACEAYKQLVKAVLARVETLRTVTLLFSPDDAAPEIEPWLRPGWKAAPQGEGDLGERLTRAFDKAFASGARRVAIIGSDCPHITASDVREAFKYLDTNDCVIGPATDGGYWLIGLKKPAPELFSGVSWSTDAVLGQTLQRAKQSSLRIHLLSILEDVDTPEDWKRWNAERE